jgi:hypothetical protein
MSNFRVQPLNYNTLIIERRTGANKNLPVVVYCHGGADPNGNSLDLLTNSGTGVSRNYGHEVFETVAEAGYRLMLPGVGAWFGATGGQTIIDAMYTQAVAAGFPNKIHIWGGSNGGCLALNWMWRNPSKVASGFMHVPLVAVERLYNESPGFQSAITTAYGHTPTSTDYDNFDPARNHAALATQASKLKVWYGTSDTVLPANSVQNFVSAVGCASTQTTANHFNGYDPSFWDRQVPVAWFDAHTA